MPTVTYEHKRPPFLSCGLWDCCPRITFPTDIPDTVSDPVDEDSLSMLVPAVGTGTLLERLHAPLTHRIAAAAQSRGFYDVTATDVQLTT